MQPRIEFNECLRDSPRFRKYLEEEESSIEHLEQKLEKTLKMCTILVDSGKEYVKNQSAFATSLWDLRLHFNDNKTAHNGLGKIVHCFQEMNKYQTILLDQASRTILKNITSFLKTDIKEVKEYKNIFVKASESYDTALTRNAQANKNRPQEVMEAANILSAASSGFRHTALDYVNLLTLLQSKKMPEILSTLLNYYQACNTFYHQGSDLCTDYEEFFRGISNDINTMRLESSQLEKAMQNRHTSVSQFAENRLSGTVCPNIDPTNVNQFEGYLFKRTSKGFKTWNRRWFYLRDNQLLYVKRDSDDAPTVMEEDLRICTVRPVNDSDRRFCFEVISPTKSHILQADSAEVLNAWIAALHKRIGAAIQDHRGPNKTIDSLTNALPGSKKIRKVKCEQFWNIPGNDKCCDCGDTEPRWASINLGITLCIACSGVHRSLGVHYSKVRSITLDAWEPEILKVMNEMGNDIVNSIYEANYNSERIDDCVDPDEEFATTNSTNQIVRANRNSDNAVREAWIKAKYVERRFVVPLSKLATNDGAQLRRRLDVHFADGEWRVRRMRRQRDKLEPPINEDSASSSEVSTDSARSLNDDFYFGSDHSTDGEANDDNSTEMEKGTNPVGNKVSADLLLYKASAAHNLPVMCYSLALSASKTWTNERHLDRMPLHQAVLSGSVMACEYLLLNGCHINSVDENGYTPLHLACEKQFTAQVRLLLKHQAKHDIAANDGKKPIDIAMEHANADIVTLIRLKCLNEEIGIEEHGTGEADTYNDVMDDFSRFSVSQLHKNQRSKAPCD